MPYVWKSKPFYAITNIWQNESCLAFVDVNEKIFYKRLERSYLINNNINMILRIDTTKRILIIFINYLSFEDNITKTMVSLYT